MTDPTTPEEWQEAVDGAYILLSLDSARQYGLISGGPAANVERCIEILRRGTERGVTPRADVVDRYIEETEKARAGR